MTQNTESPDTPGRFSLTEGPLEGHNCGRHPELSTGRSQVIRGLAVNRAPSQF